MIDPATNEGRIARRASFDPVARLYDRMRPGYPQALFEDVIANARLDTRSRLLEIGCGTGHATRVFAKLGFGIDCIELGENMAAVACANLAQFAHVTVTCADFDHWSGSAPYDLIYSASAYHWLNPDTRVERIAHHLAPGGSVAIWRNHHVRGSGTSDQFFQAARSVYAREAPAIAAKFTGLLDAVQIAPAEREEWLASDRFLHLDTHTYLWSHEYSADEYVCMLDTHSDHRLLPEANRGRLFTELVHLADEFGGTVVREYATILHFAQKRG